MATGSNKLWVTRLKESTPIDVVASTFSTNASPVQRVTLLAGGLAAVTFLSPTDAKTAKEDVKKVDGRQVAIEPYKDEYFFGALPKQAAKIKVPFDEAQVLLDQSKQGLLLLARRQGVLWTEDTVEGLHIYCDPSKGNVVLGEISNIRRKAMKTEPDKPDIKSLGTDKDSRSFGMSLAQTAMPNLLVEDSRFLQETVVTYPSNGNGSKGNTSSSSSSEASALPPPAPEIDESANLAQCMVTRLRTTDPGSVNQMAALNKHQMIGNMEIKIKDELLHYLIKNRGNEMKQIESRHDVTIDKHPGKIVLALPPNSDNSKAISLAYSDFLELYNSTQQSVKFINLDVRPLKMDQETLSKSLEKVKVSCPKVCVFDKINETGHVTLVGPETDIKKAFLHLPVQGKIGMASPPTDSSDPPTAYKKDIKGKDGYSYIGDLDKLNKQKVYTYKDTKSGTVISVKTADISMEEVDAVVQYCDTQGQVLSLIHGTGRAHLGSPVVGQVTVSISNVTKKGAQVVFPCVSSGVLSKDNLEEGLKNALVTCSQKGYQAIALPPLSTGSTTSALDLFSAAFTGAFRSFVATEGASTSLKDIRLVSKDQLAVEILSDKFDEIYTRLTGPLSKGAGNAGGASPAGGKMSWGNKLKQLASPENK